MDKSLNTVFGELNEKSFKYLLITLLIMFFVVPLLGGAVSRVFPWFAKFLYLVMFFGVLWGASNITSRNRIVYFSVIGGSLIALLLNGVFLYRQHETLLIVNHLIISIVLIFVIFSLTRYLFICKDVTHYTLFAALCSYLLIALLWSMLYGIVDMLDPGAFNIPETISSSGRMASLGSAKSFHGLYYSMVTITTLGYGDISPITTEARMLSTAEAFVGQMYVAVTIARLVGIYTGKSLMELKG